MMTPRDRVIVATARAQGVILTMNALLRDMGITNMVDESKTAKLDEVAMNAYKMLTEVRELWDYDPAKDGDPVEHDHPGKFRVIQENLCSQSGGSCHKNECEKRGNSLNHRGKFYQCSGFGMVLFDISLSDIVHNDFIHPKGKQFIDICHIRCDQTEHTIVINAQPTGDEDREKYADEVAEN